MQKKGANISLKGYDDIFSTDQSRAEAQQERVQEIPLSELHPFEGHPFRVVDDEEMMKTAESVRDFGVLTPAIVRPDPDGGYEIVSGHRRHRASELAGKETMPAIVRDLDDDAAIILMVDANLQRESILPSERAFAYKMKLDAIKHQGQRTDLTSSQVGMKLQAMDIVGQEAGESRNQVHRYIRLTELIPELLDMVDTGQIKFNPAVELSYLASEEQKDFLSAMDYAQAAPSLSQAQRIKKLAQEGECTLDAMCEIMDILRSKLLLPSMIKWKILGKFMNDKVWIRSLALGFLFVLSSVVTSYMVFILKKYFNAMNHPWAVYGMLLFMQIIIGLVGEKINQGMRVGKMNIIQRICVLVPALLLFISSVMFRQNGISGNGFLAWYSELLDGGVVLGCVLVSDLCFYIVNAINGRTC